MQSVDTLEKVLPSGIFKDDKIRIYRLITLVNFLSILNFI